MTHLSPWIGRVIGLALTIASPSIFAQAAPAPAPGTQPGVPRIQFSETTFDFGKVKPTDTLKHDFIVTNTGTAMLEITAVQPGCGCTTAGAWDKQIEPGKTGKIPIQLNPTSFSGPVSKGVNVSCNDPAQPSQYLHIQATVWRPIDVQPQYAYFMPVLGEETNETKIVRIVSNMDEDLKLEAPHSGSPLFKTELKTVRAGKEFELQITYLGAISNASPQGNISINTSAAVMPVLNINAVAMTQPAVVAFPSPLALPPGPFKAEYTCPVTVRNNSREPLKLSAPTVNVDGVKVTIQESDPGRMMNLNLTFPAGFQLKTGQSAELAVNTSHPKNPVLRIAITQPEPVLPVSQPVATPGGAK
jgi:hypothetical protein